MNINKLLRKNLISIPGWRTDRRIVVIESDDWGSIRMPSRQVYDKLVSKGIPVDKHYFLKYDALESENDLSALFEVLLSFKDKNGNNPSITANAVVANPDFEKIIESGKSAYFFEPITETYKKYPGRARTLELWKETGMDQRLLWPQFHGREHLHVKRWMEAIRSDDRWEREGFENKVLLGLKSKEQHVGKQDYMAAFGYSDNSEWEDLDKIACQGLELFTKIFGFPSTSFVAPCSIKGDHLDETLHNNGIKYHQCGQQYMPARSGSLKVINRLWGQQNSLGQVYWRRNCTFEPSRNWNYDWVNSCMSEINIAFRWGKPAVVNSHRVNFMGEIFPENRTNTNKQLSELLSRILKKWPDVEFLTSDQLGDIIMKSRVSKRTIS